MELESYPIPSEDPDRSTKHVYLDRAEIERLLELLLTHTAHQLLGTSTCLRNPSQCCATSSECSLTRIRFSSTQLAVVEVHCERLSRWVLSTALDSKFKRTLRDSPGTP